MIKKKIKKKFVQRLQHIVRFDVEFDCKHEERSSHKPLISFIQAGGISDKKFLLGDLIISINNIKIKTISDLDFEVNKLNWGDKVLFEVKREDKIQEVKINTVSFDSYTKKKTVWPIEVELKHNLLKIKNKGIEYEKFNKEIEDGDILISINSEEILSESDYHKKRSKYKVGDEIEFEIKKIKNSKLKRLKIKLINFKKSIMLNKKSCENFYLKKAGALLFKEWEATDFGHNHEDWNMRREEILQLEEIAERFAKQEDQVNIIKHWLNKDIRLINKLVKPEFKDINFKLNFFSLIFHPKIIEKLKSLSLTSINECCYSFLLTGKAINGSWDKNLKGNIKSFEKLISVRDKKKELFIDKISEVTKNFFFNLIIDKKRELNIKYLSIQNNKPSKRNAVLSSEHCGGFENIISLLKFWFNRKYGLNKAEVKQAIDDWCKSFFLEYPDFTYERIEEIQEMELEDEPEYTEDENSKIFISTQVNKKKVNGKESFVVKFKSFPDDYELEKILEKGKKIFLKIYVYDVTDLNSDKYYEIQDTTGDTDKYFSNNCHIIKTENFSWSEGNNVLVQSKVLESEFDRPNEIAFPYSVMQLPKYGKRKLEFRSFICTEDLKFDENDGRFIFRDNDHGSFIAEVYYLDGYEFNEYGDYPEILAYSSSVIDVEYKQPGYLELNRRKYKDLKIALSFALTQDNENNINKNFDKIKEDIRYGDFSAEGNINKILSLKKYYEQASKNKINLDDILKDFKKNSLIYERYEIIDFLLNLATKDGSFSNKENDFIDKISKQLELNKENYQEIKKQKTASVKLVDFGESAGENVFGLNKNMSNDEKMKILRKEYSRWNALTNNSDKTIRERAREMRDLAANLRSEYNK